MVFLMNMKLLRIKLIANSSHYLSCTPVSINRLNCDEQGIDRFIEYFDSISDKCYNDHKIWCLDVGVFLLENAILIANEK
jgi:hypothetical protein